MKRRCDLKKKEIHDLPRSFKSEYKAEEKWLSVQEAAKYIGQSVGTIYNWVCLGKLPRYKLGRNLRFPMSELNELLFKTKKEF